MRTITHYSLKFKFEQDRMKVNTYIVFVSLFVFTIGQSCTATSQAACQRCKNSLFFDGICQPCESAVTEYSCELCKGYYFHEKRCLPCKDLTNPSQCQECRGFFFIDGKCSPCELAPPYLCNLQCPDYFLKRGICTHCSQASDEMTCKFCQAPFEFKAGKCLQCPKHYTTSLLQYECMSCAGLNNQLLCKTCDEFYFANSTCKSCTNATDSASCALCEQFFFNGSTCKHCNAAGQKQCAFCRNHVFSNGFCVPCRLLGETSACSTCVMFRFSTDRQMCVPCQKKGYFLNENNTCDHCLNAKSEDNCVFCSGFAFEPKNKVCMNCSQIIQPKKCQRCLDFYYSDTKLKCLPCANSTLLDCLVQCPGFFYKQKCTNCLEASTRDDCKSCGSTFYWSSSGKCSICLPNDFFVNGDECVPCSRASRTQCDQCRLHFYSGAQCVPCKLAKTNEECSKCSASSFYFTPRFTCEICIMASSSQCSQQNCPGFGYFNGSCKRASSITSQSQCIKYPYFSYTSLGCQYCYRSSEYLNLLNYQCFKCNSFNNSTECGKCTGYYFNSLNGSCSSCSAVTNKTLCSQCLTHFFTNSKCVPCEDLGRESDCLQCRGFLYRQGECVTCNQAISVQQCLKCQYHSYQDEKCKRCEAITDMNICEVKCAPQGYFPARDIGVCATCSSAQSQNECALCPTHTWNNLLKKCTNCNDSQQVCLNCVERYWNGNACQQCSTRNCNACSSDGKTCIQCKPSYSLSANLTCNKECNAKYCRRCLESSSEYCSECLPDYSYSAIKGQCVLECQVTRCSVCLSNSQCQTCEEGFTLKSDRSACVCSISNCDSCQLSIGSSSVKCNRCLVGFSYNSASNTCNKIQCNRANCEVCRNQSACETCLKGWKIDTYRICSPICSIAGCSNCSSVSTCEGCLKGFKLISDKECEPVCNITNCLKCKTQSTCDKCSDYYSPSKDSLTCESKCPARQYFSNGVCGSCQGFIKSCEKCGYEKEKLTCSKCQPSYVFAYGECTSCTFLTPNCIDCRLTSNVFECVSCSFGFSLLGRRCRKCADNCMSCTNSGEDDCDECIKGYVYNPAAANSFKCIPCLNSCATCKPSNISSCITCFEGHYLANSTCQKCASNCKSCMEKELCFECIPGYFQYNSACYKKEIPSCMAYEVINGQISCISCAEGYQTSNNMRTCSLIDCSSSSSCLICPKTQYLSSGKCLNCRQLNCERCNEKDQSRCTKCLPGFYLQADLSCVKCMQGCASCSSKYRCKKEAEGYFLENGVNLPVLCPAQCSSCNNNYLCFSCKPGYVLYKFKCVSEESLRMTVTVRPSNNKWNDLNSSLRFQNLMKSWTLYQDELIKLIGYENREDMVFIDGVSTGSITYYLLIDLLPTQDVSKVIEKIQRALTQKSRVFKSPIISHNIFRKSKMESASPSSSSASPVNGNDVVFIAITAVLAAILCIVGVVMLKRYITARLKVAQAPQQQPTGIEKSTGTGSRLDGFKQSNKGSCNSSDEAGSSEGDTKLDVNIKQSQ